MSDYRRLISYIYEYEGREKGKNVGFAKLETRNGQCRLSVHVKRIYVGGNAIGVYLLGKNEEKLQLGNMFVRNGIGEFQTMIDRSDVEGSGTALDTYYGLTVHDVKHEWRSYRTIWEDAPVPEASAVSEDQDEAEDHVVLENPAVSENLAVQSNAPVSTSSNLPANAESEPEIKQNKEQVEVKSGDPGDDEQKIRKNSGDRTDAEFGVTAQDVLPGSEQLPNAQPTRDAVPEMAGEMPWSAELENPEVIRYLQETEETMMDPELLWKDLRKTYPKIQPFDYDGGSEVLTIRPQDIGKLPRENWIYGNNSFLLHGYYNFRYLILVRLEQPGGTPRYLLGVPGHYYSSEKYMATMFGFPNFVLSKKQPPNDGRFGYWYTDMKMR